MDQQEWLDHLKPGEQVAREYPLGYHLSVVQKRTPSGRIVLDTGEQYDRYGKHIGGSRYDQNSIVEATPDILANIKHRELVSEVSNLITKLTHGRLNALNDDALQEIVQILGKHVSQK